MITERTVTGSAQMVVSGILAIVVMFLFWYSLVGNPLDELALIRHAEVVEGFIVETGEEVGETDYGSTIWTHYARYTYRLPDGREFYQTTRGTGRLSEEFYNLQEPYPVEIEYHPDDPSVSRIKGDGSDTLFEWLWRKVGLGLLLLVIFLSPGVRMLWSGVRDLRVNAKDASRSQIAVAFAHVFGRILTWIMGAALYVAGFAAVFLIARAVGWLFDITIPLVIPTLLGFAGGGVILGYFGEPIVTAFRNSLPKNWWDPI